MKKLFYLVFLLIGFTTTAQNNTATHLFLSTKNNASFKSALGNLNIFQNKAFLNPNYLSIYNQNTTFNDNYFILGNQYYMSNTKTLNYFNGQKVDSFNPSGSSDFKSALGIGALNFLIQKL
ncbi:hypothetical protein ACSVH2_01095 [Flavobacterium sp. RSB2_4_14]|uniref:hypothetical protein n=1 Tax=Flavobacterium sp. RSB2_4_14 TaxID=3447665 RepID=UPI003F34E57B